MSVYRQPAAPPPDKQRYYEQVWVLVRQVPAGRVATYGQIAKLIPPPAGVSTDEYRLSAARWVGLAMAACPDDVPWQRVINSQGRVSPRPEAAKQRQLLQAEGILFANDKLDLNEYLWAGPGVKDNPVQSRLF